MARRTYQQQCALACALDVVGERWTLLLVRELMPGPRRYKELLQGLVGMGTNLLAARLRDLEAAGVVEREGPEYRLTERGRELEDAVLALARFGAPLLVEADPQGLWLARWNAVALKYAFRPERAKKLRGVIEFRVDEDATQARLRDGAIETGVAAWKPDVVVTTDGETFRGLGAGRVDLAAAEAGGTLAIDGDRRFFRSCLRAFASS